MCSQKTRRSDALGLLNFSFSTSSAPCLWRLSLFLSFSFCFCSVFVVFFFGLILIALLSRSSSSSCCCSSSSFFTTSHTPFLSHMPTHHANILTNTFPAFLPPPHPFLSSLSLIPSVPLTQASTYSHSLRHSRNATRACARLWPANRNLSDNIQPSMTRAWLECVKTPSSLLPSPTGNWEAMEKGVCEVMCRATVVPLLCDR